MGFTLSLAAFGLNLPLKVFYDIFFSIKYYFYVSFFYFYIFNLIYFILYLFIFFVSIFIILLNFLTTISPPKTKIS